MDHDRLYDKNGTLTSSAGAVVTGFRTTLAALAAGTVAAIGVRYTHRTLQHTKESQATDRYIELVHRADDKILDKALADPALLEVLDAYDEDIPEAKRRQFVFAEMRYRSYLLPLELGVMSPAEFHGKVRVLLRSRIFREYWHETRFQRMSLLYESVEAGANRITDELARQLNEADVDEWWVIGEPPSQR
ncbi:DUF6082 family protein [Streptomyces chartreusis]|uniref:DUF6082 family protein n=1 Tax=Streptomyces chartreusis TaxID=1969 RepID=UPI0035E1E17B